MRSYNLLLVIKFIREILDTNLVRHFLFYTQSETKTFYYLSTSQQYLSLMKEANGRNLMQLYLYRVLGKNVWSCVEHFQMIEIVTRLTLGQGNNVADRNIFVNMIYCAIGSISLWKSYLINIAFFSEHPVLWMHFLFLLLISLATRFLCFASWCLSICKIPRSNRNVETFIYCIHMIIYWFRFIYFKEIVNLELFQSLYRCI